MCPTSGSWLRAVTPSTRVVAVSSIQSLDGAVADLASLRHACDRVGALLLVDVSQHLGVVPFDFAASVQTLPMAAVTSGSWAARRDLC